MNHVTKKKKEKKIQLEMSSSTFCFNSRYILAFIQTVWTQTKQTNKVMNGSESDNAIDIHNAH